MSIPVIDNWKIIWWLFLHQNYFEFKWALHRLSIFWMIACAHYTFMPLVCRNAIPCYFLTKKMCVSFTHVLLFMTRRKQVRTHESRLKKWRNWNCSILVSNLLLMQLMSENITWNFRVSTGKFYSLIFVMND